MCVCVCVLMKNVGPGNKATNTHVYFIKVQYTVMACFC